MQKDERDKAPVWLQIAIQLLIIYSLITMTLETMPELADYYYFFHISEAVIVILFTIEYIGFWIVSDRKWRYPFKFFTIIDLIAILPFYLQLGIGLQGVRILRLLRMVRILKLGKFNRAMGTLADAIKRTGPELILTSVVAVLFLWIAATLLYYAEHDAQPDVYTSIPASLWSAVVTMTTVGYGDMYPQTVAGKIICVFIMVAGIAIVAVPTGIISSQLTELLRERRESQQEKVKRTAHFRDQ